MSPTILDIFDRVTVLENYASLLSSYEIVSCNIDTNYNSIKLYLKGQNLLPIPETKAFINMTKQSYGLNDFEIFVKYPGLDFSDQYFSYLLDAFLASHDAGKAFLIGATGELNDNTLIVKNINGCESALNNMNFSAFMREHIAFGIDLNVTVNLCFAETDREEYLKRQSELESKLVAASIQERRPEKAAAPSESPKSFGKYIDENPTPIIKLTEETKYCVVEGEIIDFESRDIVRGNRSNTSIKFSIGDDEWATTCSAFGNSEKMKALTGMLKEGNRLKVAGNYEFDEYLHSFVIKVTSALLIPAPPVRQDTYPKKRVELHMHTKMSAMDAVSSVGSLVDRAAYWGHPAVAITDHGVAQGFPDARKAAKAHKGLKMIYGMEGYLIDDIDSKRLNDIREMRKGTYIIFDLETTGLSSDRDRITEIGAVKIRDGIIVDKFSQLVNPEMEISEQITELTGITNEMVEDKPTIDKVLPKFQKFCGDGIMVAHNAKFDMGFIYSNARRLKLYFPNKTMDTLEMSRNIFKNENNHKLNIICQRLGVELNNHHRAVADATATAYCFMKMMDMTAWKDAAAAEAEIPELDKDNPVVKTRKYHIILLAQNYVGLKNLYQLISRSNLDYFYRKPGIPKSLLHKYREGIIVGSACESGELYRAIINKKSEDELAEIAKFYDYLEIQPLGNNAFMKRNGQVRDDNELIEINKKIVSIGDKIGRKTVATCDVHFLDPKDEMYRRVLMGAQGFEDADNQAPLYLRTTAEMMDEFSYLGDRAEEIVIDNTVEIADMIEDIQPVKDGSYPPTIENCEQDLIDMCHSKAHEIYGDNLPEIVEERMERELGCIVKYGYSVMYMIAHKLVKKSNDAGYLVGSRGSVGSSFVAFLSGITEVNALCPHYVCPDCKYSEFYDNGEYPTGMDMPNKTCPKCGAPLRKDGLTIPFETFLGFEGDKVPDIDLNFSGEYQATAHKYVGELFGDGYVFKAGTIGTIADKTAVMFARKYYEKKEIVAPDAELKRISKGIVDVKRTTGQHPGGIIVCPKTMDIHDFTPVQHPADKKDSDIITTHFDFHSIHDNLLKLDILGHDDPSTIRMLEDLTGINALEIPLDDKETMSLFSSTEALGIKPEQIDSKVGTFGVPEFGTNFVRGMLVDTMPTTFVELLIISGLSHGTDVWLNNAQDLVKNKTATLSEVIGLRDDIMVYLLHHGLEPSMAFKIMEFVRKGRAAKEGMPEDFEAAMRENNVPEWYINSCKKIKYMFPKAHAAAYVMMAFRIAYFKVHYPAEFYMAYFTVRADLFDAAIMAHGEEKVIQEMKKIKIKGNSATANEKNLLTILEICQEMYERGIDFAPVDLYESHPYKFGKKDGKILPPLNAFAGVGTNAAEAIASAREDGDFMSKEDLKNRAGITKTVIEVLGENGVLDSLPDSSQISF